MSFQSDSTPAISWNSLSALAIDSIAKHLKKTDRWRDDGPSLRLLNKHWCAAMEKNVTRAWPVVGKVKDLRLNEKQSLLKFPNLQSVDIMSFWLSGLDAAFDTSYFLCDNWWGDVSPVAIKQRLVDLLDVLGRFPSLREIGIRDGTCWKCANILEDPVVREKIRCLKGVDSVVLGGHPHHNQIHNEGLIPLISQLPISKFSGLLPLRLNSDSPTIRDQFPLLKETGLVCYLGYPETEECHRLRKTIESLGTVHLAWGGPISFQNLVGLPQVSSIYFEVNHCQDLPVLGKLTQLKHLAFCQDDEKDDCYYELLRNVLPELAKIPLKSLDIRNWFGDGNEVIDRMFLEKMTNLRYLAIDDVSVNASDILRYLPRLEVLEISYCRILDQFEFWSYADKPDTVEGESFQRIVALHISGAWSSAILPAVAKLKNLKKFAMGHLTWCPNSSTKAYYALRELEVLSSAENLRELTLLRDWSTVTPEEFEALEFFTTLRKLCITEENPPSHLIESFHRLKNKAPQLYIQFIDTLLVGAVFSEYYGLE